MPRRELDLEQVDTGPYLVPARLPPQQPVFVLPQRDGHFYEIPPEQRLGVPPLERDEVEPDRRLRLLQW